MNSYITKIISRNVFAGQECCISYKVHTGCYFKLSSGGKIIVVSFETNIINGLLPSCLILAQSVLNKISLSSLAYGIVSITKRVTYITNEVLTSKHDCVFEVYTFNLKLSKRPAGCMLYTRRCSAVLWKIILSTYCIVQKNLTACLITLIAIVNFVSKV